MPASGSSRRPELSEGTARRTEQAGAAVMRLEHLVGEQRTTVVAHLLHRAEGVASSEVEALRAPSERIAFAEASGVDPGGDAAWIADNLAVVADAVGDRRRIDDDVMSDWHTRIMRHGRIHPDDIGRFRDRLGWVGGHSPRVAAHVASPAEGIDEHMADLYRFCERDDLDPITVVAVAHAHFETIHPFVDGNGRIGRVLVSNLVARRHDVTIPPPLSMQIRRDIGGYQAGLGLYRHGHVDPWVRWFADSVIAAAELAEIVAGDAAAIIERWAEAVSDLRADAAARRLVVELAAHPVVSTQLAAQLCAVSLPAARTALGYLLERGIIDELDITEPARGRPRHWYAATELLELADR